MSKRHRAVGLPIQTDEQGATRKLKWQLRNIISPAVKCVSRNCVVESHLNAGATATITITGGFAVECSPLAFKPRVTVVRFRLTRHAHSHFNCIITLYFNYTNVLNDTKTQVNLKSFTPYVMGSASERPTLTNAGNCRAGNRSLSDATKWMLFLSRCDCIFIARIVLRRYCALQ